MFRLLPLLALALLAAACGRPLTDGSPTAAVTAPVATTTTTAAIGDAPRLVISTFGYDLDHGAFAPVTLTPPLTLLARCATWPQLVYVQDRDGLRAWIDQTAAAVSDLTGVEEDCRMRGL